MKDITAAIFKGAARFEGADIDDKDGVKKKMATYYRKMKMPPPWEKGATMDIWSKDYTESYQQTVQQDWVSDLWNLWYPLRNEIITAFQTGDTPVEDVQAAVKQFGAALLSYVQRGVELDMTEYLQPDDNNSSPNPAYMSADDNPETKEAKAGRMISAANHAKLTAAVKGIGEHIMQIKSTTGGIDEHIMAIKKVLSSASPAAGQNRLSGYQVYGEDDPTPEQKDEEDDPPQTKEEQLVDVHTLLHDLTMLLSADNANRGV